MNLNHQDIQAILQILDSAPYNELQLENNDFKLYLKRDDKGEWSQELTTLSPVNELQTETNQISAHPQQSTNRSNEPAPSEEGLIDIRAPMVGTFYRSPHPGAGSFVEIGDLIEENTVIAIIEVMKLMSSIPARINGEVREILAEDAQLVEKGQLIMRVKSVSP